MKLGRLSPCERIECLCHTIHRTQVVQVTKLKFLSGYINRNLSTQVSISCDSLYSMCQHVRTANLRKSISHYYGII